MITTSAKPFYTPQNTSKKPNQKQSASFGINVTHHAQKRIAEHGIDLKRAINTVRTGSKFLIFEKGQNRIVNLGFNGKGKVPEGTLMVITDTTGDVLITACKTNANECEILGEKLRKVSHHNPQNVQLLDTWRRNFDRKIFGVINFLKEQPHTGNHRDIHHNAHHPRKNGFND